ncbi:hypothetical protein SBD_0100 [Streptomyces bottropensis ATCC 25435]|uniref:Uncharacterized protein n=1 Tax=Streptomyces bottropensis ATCC 25435 TaxID=1054862 RepID=M3F724_9ACTN|nr:hypothetical protein SBD_0100 [Streptomyces bottropensis ATCC 25435]
MSWSLRSSGTGTSSLALPGETTPCRGDVGEGVLSVEAPKADGARPRRIEMTGGK